MLEAGGNAFDAAVGTALALATVEPWNSGLGGIGFALVHRAGQPRAEVVDFGPVAPRGLSPHRFRLTGAHDAGPVPLAAGGGRRQRARAALLRHSLVRVAGYAACTDTWGRLPLAEVMAPAIALARRGLPEDWFTCLKVALSAAVLRRYPESARIYLPDGLPPIAALPGRRRASSASATCRQRWSGWPRRACATSTRATSPPRSSPTSPAMGGVLVSADDLRAATRACWPPTEVAWRDGRTMQLASGLTAAPTLARVLEQMARCAVAARRRTPPGTSRLARAMKAAYAERLEGLGDADPSTAESCTTHLTVCDAEGNMVAMTTTLALLDGQPRGAAGHRRADEQRGDVVRPAPGPAELDRAGQAAADQHVPADPARRRPPGARGRRLRRAAHHGGGAADADLRHRVRHERRRRRRTIRASMCPAPTAISVDRAHGPGRSIAALAAEGPIEVVEHGVMPVNFACPNADRAACRTAPAPASATRSRPGRRRWRRQGRPGGRRGGRRPGGRSLPGLAGWRYRPFSHAPSSPVSVRRRPPISDRNSRASSAGWWYSAMIRA